MSPKDYPDGTSYAEIQTQTLEEILKKLADIELTLKRTNDLLNHIDISTHATALSSEKK